MTPGPRLPRGTPLPTLTTLRIIWAALLVGQVAFFTVILFLKNTPPTTPQPDESFARTLLVVEIAMLVTTVPAAFIVRQVIFARGRSDDGLVSRDRFSTGTIVFLTLLEGTSVFGLVVTLLTRQVVPYALPSLLAFLIQLVSFPRGDSLADR